MRGYIEYFFKVCKQTFNMYKIHKYTPESFTKDRFLYLLIIKLVLNTAENKNSITIVKPTMIY
ncbi:hypothetical protein [Methanosphaera stadtmanae]|uniref:hypothetical protein n=1 Tax=Methanosphaera stadtmanae TaxID=2317 RepID=UPI002E7A3F6D|nr:hypothetical protein [Methanosphaera stadtmanae]MEE0489835.1 hypothetical protein [Methanosphaera stadtmanae]